MQKELSTLLDQAAQLTGQPLDEQTKDLMLEAMSIQPTGVVGDDVTRGEVKIKKATGDSITATHRGLLRFQPDYILKLLKEASTLTGMSATALAIYLSSVSLILLGAAVIVWGMLHRKLTKVDGEVLFILWKLGKDNKRNNRFQQEEVLAKYQEVFERPLKPAHFSDAIDVFCALNITSCGVDTNGNYELYDKVEVRPDLGS